MRRLPAVLFFIPGIALAHDALAPHSHPHAASMLPDLSLFVIDATLFVAAVLLARYIRRGRRS